MALDLTEGSIPKKLIQFSLPLIAGNLLQQLYNVADTLIVGRCLGPNALAAVGSAYALMVFLTSILLGLCMGCSAFFSMQYGARELDRLKNGMFQSFVLVGSVAVLLTILSYVGLEWVIRLLNVPTGIDNMLRDYLGVIFAGILATFLYNYFANLLRAVGNSSVPLAFLAVAAVLNIVLDLLFVLVFQWGVRGAAAATVAAQYTSGIALFVYYWLCLPALRIQRRHLHRDSSVLCRIAGLSLLTCIQQSVMNFGILMVQGLVNRFGAAVMAAFAAAVKIDSFAYMPAQDFGNAFSTFVAQNHGAGKAERIRQGIRCAAAVSAVFCVAAGAVVDIFAAPLMGLFIDAADTDIIAAGVGYLRIEAPFYFGIGLLFLLYGFYRAVGRPGVSVVLTVISLGTRVALAYALSTIPAIGVSGIWVSVPIGWMLADLTGILCYLSFKRVLHCPTKQTEGKG